MSVEHGAGSGRQRAGSREQETSSRRTTSLLAPCSLLLPLPDGGTSLQPPFRAVPESIVPAACNWFADPLFELNFEVPLTIPLVPLMET
jgi:hypothetical protein